MQKQTDTGLTKIYSRLLLTILKSILMNYFDRILERDKGIAVIEEIVLQSRVEFNMEAEEQDVFLYENTVEDE